MDDVDYSAAAALRETYELLKLKGIRFVLVEIQESVRAELNRSKVTELVGTQYIYDRIAGLENAYKQSLAPVEATGK
jgi:anti-anti-sigma regulatory factor